MSNQNNTYRVFLSDRQVAETANRYGSRVERISSLTKQDIKSYVRLVLKHHPLLHNAWGPIVGYICQRLRGEIEIQEYLYAFNVTHWTLGETIFEDFLSNLTQSCSDFHTTNMVFLWRTHWFSGPGLVDTRYIATIDQHGRTGVTPGEEFFNTHFAHVCNIDLYGVSLA